MVSCTDMLGLLVGASNVRLGTLITIQREPEREFGTPIYERLRLRDTLLRSSGDASLLLQSLIDLSKHTPV
jgi:hypothetical protein